MEEEIKKINRILEIDKDPKGALFDHIEEEASKIAQIEKMVFDIQELVKDAVENKIDGQDGLQGGKGDSGEIGPMGPQGPDGEKGEPGFNGMDGIDGRDGLDGQNGKDGERGEKGDKGEKGDTPDHEWDGTALRFEHPEGKWGEWVDLRGKPGRDGLSGNSYSMFSGGGSPSSTAEVHDSLNKRYVSDNERDLITSIAGTGLLTGGLLSINADNTKFDLSAGEGYIIDNHTDPTNPVVTKVTWNAFTAQVVTNIATQRTTNIFVNSSGQIIQNGNTVEPEDARDYIIIGRLVHTNLTNISNVLHFPHAVFNGFLHAMDIDDAIGTVNVSGNLFGPDGVNLTMNKTSGQTYRVGTNYANSKKSPNFTTDAAMTPVTFRYQYRNGSGGFTTTNTTTNIDPNNYDNGTGTLADIPSNNRYSIQRIYYSAASATVFVTYGQAYYSTLIAAQAGIGTESPAISPALQETSLRGFIVIKDGTTDLNNTADCVFVQASKFGEILVGSSVGTGDVIGPTTSTDNAIARFDGTTGKMIQSYTSNAPTVSDTGEVNIPSSITVSTLTGVLRSDSGLVSVDSTVTSGTYTPTLTNVANLDSSTAYSCQYLRIGTVVTVSGKVDIDPTLTATSTQLGISLPVASNIANNNECSGTAFASGVAGQGASILGDATNNRAQLQYISGDVTNQSMYFTFTYRII